MTSEKLKKIEKEIYKTRKRNMLKNILNNIVFMSALFLSLSTVFSIDIASKPLFYIMVTLLGISRYLTTELQSYDDINEIYKTSGCIAAHLIVLENAITEIQKLSTDEDIVDRCKDEFLNKLEKEKITF